MTQIFFVSTESEEERVEPAIRVGGGLDEVLILGLAALLGGGAMDLMLPTQVEIDLLGFNFFEGGT